MKIEKVNDNQIRCTLTKSDLKKRHLKISELAYGSEKTKSLFKDMMEQAAYEFGFEADDIPLMIEAVPMSDECIVLTITKVEDPEELDTRFAKFAPSVMEGEEVPEDVEDLDASAEELPYFKVSPEKAPEKVGVGAPPEGPAASGKEQTSSQAEKDGAASKEQSGKEPTSALAEVLFAFQTLDDLIQLAGVMSSVKVEHSSLYKDQNKNCYLLHVTRGDMSAPAFQKVYFALAEYGVPIRPTPDLLLNLAQQYEELIPDHALEKLLEMC